jgi:hypothetical protein
VFLATDQTTAILSTATEPRLPIAGRQRLPRTASYSQRPMTTATKGRPRTSSTALSWKALTGSPCIRSYAIRVPPQAGQSRPVSALNGQRGSQWPDSCGSVPHR